MTKNHIATTAEGKKIHRGETCKENGTACTKLHYEDGAPFATLRGTHP